ncbi:phage tail protein [Streptococcus uberis]|uniref:phage tail tube protein n=1 Tax=Streptococcus uberis TaxID=1349 RepID=UPI0012B5A533|nr:phage tail protein [Streptococcus uberis]MTB77338.1 phage tail protein [Streptococcus uberis]
MARLKNAKRIHEIAAFDPLKPDTEPTDWLKLAKWIETIDDETDEDTDDTGYYDGDGTPEETVMSVVGGYSFEGLYDAEDPAQALIAGMKYKTGDARRVWHRVTSADGKKRFTQVANTSEIKAGAGDATEYEQFGCTLKWIKEPKETAVTSV